MATATPLLQADLSGTAFGGAPTWTDVTRFWRLKDVVNASAWRQDALGSISPATVAFTLDNSDLPGDATAPNAGRFTPGLSSSPWTGRILPGVRIRWSETIAGTTTVVYDGYALDWTAAYDEDGTFTTCVVSCTDTLGWMGQQQPLRGMHLEEIAVDGPLALYPLEEPSGSVSASSIIGTWPNGSVVKSKLGGGAVSFGNASFPLSAGSAKFTPTTHGTGGGTAKASWLQFSNPLPASGAFSVEAWFSCTSGGGSTNTVFSYAYVNPQTGATEQLVQVDVIADGSVAHNVLTNPSTGVFGVAGNSGTTPGLINMTDGSWHHVVITWDPVSTQEKCFVDGVQINSTATSSVVGGLGTIKRPFMVGASGGYQTDKVDTPFTGSIAAVAVHGTVLSAARILAHYQAGLTGFAGERTDQRLSRFLTYRPNVGSVLDTGLGTVGLQATAGVTLQQALLDVGRAEGGLVFADGQGRIAFFNRKRLYDPVSVATFDAEADLLADVSSRIDLQNLLNDVSYARPNGPTQRIVNNASQLAFGWRSVSDTLPVNSDRDASDAAGWTVANFKTPAMRTPALSVDVLTCGAAQANAALARAPFDRCGVSNLPASASPTDVIVQGRVINRSVDTFTVSFYTSALPRRTLRAESVASANTKLDNGLVIPW